MSQKTFSLVAGLIFLVVAVLHILRLAMGWHVVIAAWTIPHVGKLDRTPDCWVFSLRGPETFKVRLSNLGRKTFPMGYFCFPSTVAGSAMSANGSTSECA